MDPVTAQALAGVAGKGFEAIGQYQQRRAQEAIAAAQVKIGELNRDVSLDTNQKNLEVAKINAELQRAGLSTQVTLADKQLKLEIVKSDYALLNIKAKSTANTILINNIIKAILVIGIILVVVVVVIKKGGE